MKHTHRRGIAFGPLAPRLSEQLGDTFPGVGKLQYMADALIVMVNEGALTEAEAMTIRQRLVRKIRGLQ